MNLQFPNFLLLKTTPAPIIYLSSARSIFFLLLLCRQSSIVPPGKSASRQPRKIEFLPLTLQICRKMCFCRESFLFREPTKDVPEILLVLLSTILSPLEALTWDFVNPLGFCSSRFTAHFSFQIHFQELIFRSFQRKLLSYGEMFWKFLSFGKN